MKQIAFWTYDLYPFTCWGEIDESRKHSYDQVYKYIPAYQSFFRPFMILSESEARPIIRELENLSGWREEEQKMIEKLFNDRLKKVLLKHPSLK